MSDNRKVTLAAAALAASFAAAPLASADGLFGVSSLSSGYMTGDVADSAKLGEGKCGEGKCGEGKCGGEKKDDAEAEAISAAEGAHDSEKGAEGSCGGDEGEKGAEGSCGGEKGAEGKCGEGKCGGSV